MCFFLFWFGLFVLVFCLFGLDSFVFDFFLNFVLNLKVEGNVLVLHFGDLHFYKIEYLLLKYSTVFDNSYSEHHNRIFERNHYEMPKYLAKNSNKS